MTLLPLILLLAPSLLLAYSPVLPWSQSGTAITWLLQFPPPYSLPNTILNSTNINVKESRGRSKGSLYYAHYDTGSSQSYHELIVTTATLSTTSQVFEGGYLGYLYVDSEDALELGRDVFGLPKVMAEFEESVAEGVTTVVVRVEGEEVITVVYEAGDCEINVNANQTSISSSSTGDLLFTHTPSTFGVSKPKTAEYTTPKGSELEAVLEGVKVKSAQTLTLVEMNVIAPVIIGTL